MLCPYCSFPEDKVVDSRAAREGRAIRRRRECAGCGRRFTTQETSVVYVVKRSGATEPFSRAKVVTGVRKACQEHFGVLFEKTEDPAQHQSRHPTLERRAA